MTTTSNKSKGLYWLLFLISCGALAAAIFYQFEYLTLILPFNCTFFVKALDII